MELDAEDFADRANTFANSLGLTSLLLCGRIVSMVTGTGSPAANKIIMQTQGEEKKRTDRRRSRSRSSAMMTSTHPRFTLLSCFADCRHSWQRQTQHAE